MQSFLYHTQQAGRCVVAACDRMHACGCFNAYPDVLQHHPRHKLFRLQDAAPVEVVNGDERPAPGLVHLAAQPLLPHMGVSAARYSRFMASHLPTGRRALSPVHHAYVCSAFTTPPQGGSFWRFDSIVGKPTPNISKILTRSLHRTLHPLHKRFRVTSSTLYSD